MNQITQFFVWLFVELFHFLVPRFVTTDVAAIKTGDDYDVVCHVSELEEEDVYDTILEMRCFLLFGYPLFAKYFTIEETTEDE